MVKEDLVYIFRDLVCINFCSICCTIYAYLWWLHGGYETKYDNEI